MFHDFRSWVGGFQASMPVAQQRLIYKGKVLKDEQTLENIGGCARIVNDRIVMGSLQVVVQATRKYSQWYT